MRSSSITATRALGIAYISTLHRAFSPCEVPERALGSANGRVPPVKPLTRNESSLPDCFEGVGDDPNPLLAEGFHGGHVWRPMGEKMDFVGVRGARQRGNHIGEGTVATLKERVD